jgi:hypothetical protein
VVAEGGADLFDVGAVGADGFVELVACDAKFLRPVGDVRRHFWVDVFGVVRALGGVVLMGGVGFVGFGCVVMFGDVGSSFRGFLVKWMRIGVVGMAGRRCGRRQFSRSGCAFHSGLRQSGAHSSHDAAMNEPPEVVSATRPSFF